jgi:sphingomyelin phosphodiesterase acid-like 3
MTIKQFINRGILLVLLAVSPAIYASNANFMTVADIHFDPFTACAKTMPCPLIEELQNAPVSEWKTILEKADTAPPQYRQDSTYVLLNSTLNALQATAGKTHPQFIIVLGDSIAHRYLEKYHAYTVGKTQQDYQEFVHKTLTFVAGEFHKKFPTTDIYFSVGNNDSYNDDYKTLPGGVFFQDMAKVWGELINTPAPREQMQQDFSSAGYYTVDIPQQPKLRLIVLNTNLFSPHAENFPTETSKEFDWLEQQLKQAYLQNQQVLIAMHIPVGIDVYASLKSSPFSIVEMWRPEYTGRFNTILQEYGNTISGILTAHTHCDSFQVIQTDNGSRIVISNTPSISPFNGNNPGFKVFSYDTESFALQDYATFYAPLTSLEWQQEYDFDAIYQTGAIQRPLAEDIELLPAAGKLAQAYQLYYDTSSNTAPIHESYNPYYRCQLRVITAAEYQTCMAKQ